MKPEIRLIEPEDNQATAQMIRAVFEEFNAPKIGTVYSDPSTDHLYELFQAAPNSVFFLTVENNKVLGSCGIYPTPGLPKGCAELVKFYLSKEARGKGLGKALMEKSTQAAIDMGYTQLYIESLPVFGKAVNIYEKQGFRRIEQALSTAHPGCNLWFLKDL